jgi:hypothetical protein
MKLGTFVRIWAAATLLLMVGIELYQALHGIGEDIVAVRLVAGLYMSVWASALAAIIVALLAVIFHKSEAK